MTRPRRLFTKNIGFHKVVRPCTGVNACPVLEGKEVGDLMIGKPMIEAPVNDSRNYNSPKVTKFFDG